jgi:RNA polymerase sigma-70 factor, ECF subfamily
VRGLASVTDDDLVALYDRSVADVYRYASRLCGGSRADTEELVQDTYMALVRHVRSSPGADVSVGWLLVTCRNRFVDVARATERRRRREVVATAGERVVEEPVDPVAAGALAALAGMPALQRAALVMRYVDDLSVAEVARGLDRSVRATESLLARGRTALRAAVGPEGEL